MKKLFLIDGMSLVFRSYYGLFSSNLKSASGEPTSAIFGFANILTSILEREKPDYLAVVFDTKEPTFRHKLYPEYKANRQSFPEDLVPQLKRIKELISLFAINQIEIPGFEADDIIGTLSDIASKSDLEVFCITSDKDFIQLVKNNVKLAKPAKRNDEPFEIVDEENVRTKFGFDPIQIIDYLALIGDSSDNVPGVKGIGDKSALPLIQNFSTLENIYENISKIESSSVKNKLLASKDIAFLSKRLVTIELNVPLDFKIEDFELKTPDYQKLDKLLTELGFNQMKSKWVGKSIDNLFETKEEPSLANITTKEKDYRNVNTTQKLDEMLEIITRANVLSVDLETSSLDRQSCEIVGISLSAKEGLAFYIPTDSSNYFIMQKQNNIQLKDNSTLDFGFFEEKKENSISNKEGFLQIELVIDKLKGILESEEIGKCGQNLKFDAYILKRYGIELKPIIFDSMVASYMLNPDEQHNLDALSQKWLNYTPIPISSLIGEKKSNQISMKDVKPELIVDYACEDADLALKLKNVLEVELEKENLSKICNEMEFPLVEVLLQMEFNGVFIDKFVLNDISRELTKEINVIAENIFDEAGTLFNIDSPKQLSSILFEKMMIKPLNKTKTGFSTNVQVLEQLAPIYPIAKYVLDYRQFVKLKNTYIDALPKLINPETGRIHTTFNQTGTSTGRLSSTEPNMQNIPIRTDAGKEIRKAFIAQNKDNVLLSADYSQVELRIMAYYSQDKYLIDAFKEQMDIHSATASILFDVDISNVDSSMRRTAKTVNFGIMYGLGSFGLSQRLGISRGEAKSIIDNYFNKYPGIKRYIENTIAQTEKCGYTETLLGRKRFFPNINSKNNNLKQAEERAAMNMPIQGTAADMMKLAMIKIHSQMKSKFKAKMLLQVHDELLFEVPKDELEDLKYIVKEAMENSVLLGDVPVVANIGVGLNWLEAH